MKRCLLVSELSTVNRCVVDSHVHEAVRVSESRSVDRCVLDSALLAVERARQVLLVELDLQ